MSSDCIRVFNLRMGRRSPVLAAAVCFLLMVQGGFAGTVTLTASDSGTVSSFNTGANWSDGLPPASGSDYVVGSGLTLQTPSLAASAVFAGNSLTVNTGARLYYIGANNGSLTVNNLILNNGKFQTSRAGGNDIPMSLYGNITIASGTTGTLSTADSGVRQTLNVYAPITGDGDLYATYRRYINFYGTNTYTGDTILSAWVTNETVATFQNSSVLLLTVQDTGANQVRATGKGTLNMSGHLALDVSGVAAGRSWTLIDTNDLFALSYGGTFSIGLVGKPLFKNDAGIWTYRSAGTWTFTQSTGVLAFAPPAGTVLIIK